MPLPLDAPLRDRLARHRTVLAHERTLLAYVRTALGFVVVGVPAVWWFDSRGFQWLGVLSLVSGVLVAAIEIKRFVSVKAVIEQCED